ncbi:MAG TPA: zf-HC2 domain-containing protein, partial [Pyrinomonadaceae bacterium]
MRNCDWTEKVSLLIDGELGSEESRSVETHLDDCLACRAAREDFLLLRRRISSYQPDVSLAAQREALRNILAAGRADSPAAGRAPAAPTSGRRSRFAELF